MTPLFPAQHAAEEFDSVLEGRATTAVAERYAGLVSTVQVLREQPEIAPRAEFVADLRSRLMLAAETDLVPADPVVRRLPSKSRRNRRLGTAAAALVIVGGTAGMAAAASGAMPGQSLYPIKRGIEQVTIAAHFGDASKGSALLGQADTRLDEVRSMIASGSADQAMVDSTVDDFTSSANSGADKLFTAYQSGADTSDITTVRDFTASAMAEVNSISTGNDPTSTGALRDVADVLTDIDQQAATLCASCGGDVISPSAALASGAGAESVNNLVGRPATQAALDVSKAKSIRAALAQARLDGLTKAAQGAANDLGKTTTAGLGSGSGPLAGNLTSPVTSTLTSSGKLVPSVTSAGTTAVRDLVGGLTGSLSSATGSTGGGDLGSTVSGTGDAVKKTVEGVTGNVDKAISGATDGVLPKDK